MSETTRRDALKMLAAGSIAASAACTRDERHERDGTKAQPAATSEHQAMSRNPVIEQMALPSTGPWPTTDPFLFCVHHNDRYPRANGSLGPASPLTGRHLGQDFSGRDGWSMYHGREVPGFPRHPHRGFETVTVVKEGIVDHADSLGAVARYGDGDTQWLTAADGINHAEMFPLFDRAGSNPIDFFQIWLNLPAKNKRVAPEFTMFWRSDVPKLRFEDSDKRTTTVTLIAGALDGKHPPKAPKSSWAADPANDVAIWTISMGPNAQWTLPACEPGSHRNLYVVSGSGISLGAVSVPPKRLARLQPSVPVTISNGDQKTELLLLQGRPIAEPVVQHGPFVMNSRAEIQQAFADYRRTQFGGWPWPKDDPVHGNKRERFAIHANGKRDTPA